MVPQKAMYGHCTSPKLWQLHLGEVLRQQQRRRQCKADRCLWTTEGLGVLIYVDDLLLVGETTKIEHVIFTLNATCYIHIEACDYVVKDPRCALLGKETITT